MQETTPSNAPPIPGRRAADSFGTDAMELLKDIHAKVTILEAGALAMTEAFVLNDLHKPDFHGHRQAHLSQIRASEVMDGYKQGITKKIIGWAVAGVIALIVGGFVAQLSGHIK